MAKKTGDTVTKNLEQYEALMKSIPGIDIKGKTMPYTSMNGNMFSFLKEGAIALRLPEEERSKFIKKFNSKLFETYGTVMKEYVEIKTPLLEQTKDIKPFVKISYEYARTLKAKPTKGK